MHKYKPSRYTISCPLIPGTGGSQPLSDSRGETFGAAAKARGFVYVIFHRFEWIWTWCLMGISRDKVTDKSHMFFFFKHKKGVHGNTCYIPKLRRNNDGPGVDFN